MRQITRHCITLLLVFALALLVACPSGTTGLLPFPVFLPVTIDLTVPVGTQTSGQQAAFAISWSHGLEPFTATWTFEGGTTGETLTSSGPDRNSEVTVTFDNAGPTAQTWPGNVVIVDSRGNTLREDFSFSVAPAP